MLCLGAGMFPSRGDGLDRRRRILRYWCAASTKGRTGISGGLGGSGRERKKKVEPRDG